MMDIRTKLSVVRIAEADCALRRASVGAAWRGLKQETERAATPGRVLGAGLVAGFVSGLRGSGRNAGGSQIGGKLFGLLFDSVFASFSAALAAGAAAADAKQNAAADARVDDSRVEPDRRAATDPQSNPNRG